MAISNNLPDVVYVRAITGVASTFYQIGMVPLTRWNANSRKLEVTFFRKPKPERQSSSPVSGLPYKILKLHREHLELVPLRDHGRVIVVGPPAEGQPSLAGIMAGVVLPNGSSVRISPPGQPEQSVPYDHIIPVL